MIVEPPEAATNSMLDTLGQLMNGGTIEMLTSEGKLVAELKLSNPATSNARDGELAFRKISEGVAAARIVASNGNLILLCDVGDENSDAVIKLNTVQVPRGSPVRLNSFVLRFADIWRESLAATRLEQPGMRSLS
jgi:hypothetical protein